METNPGAEQPPESWIHAYGGALLRACYVELRDRQLAQDALQETLIKAWRAWRKNPAAVASERAWLTRIAVNTCRDMRRAAWFRRETANVALETIAAETGASPEDGLLFLEAMRLPPALRQAVALYYGENMTLEEIARATGVRAATVHRRLKKAAAALRTRMEEGTDDA